MTSPRRCCVVSPFRSAAAGVLTLAVFPLAAPAPAVAEPAPAVAKPVDGGLPLGADWLPEERISNDIAEGVTRTVIRRGDGDAAPQSIAATDKGPWTVNLVTIDPDKAKARLTATIGADVARTERTSALAARAGALVAVNGGFFAMGSSAPGDPVGLSVIDGELISEPMARAAAIGMLVDARSMRLTISSFSWRATLSRRGATALRVNGVNRPPFLPRACRDTPTKPTKPTGNPSSTSTATPGTNPTHGRTQSPTPTQTPTPIRTAPPAPTFCDVPGELIRFSSAYGRRTPAGPGFEVLTRARGCVNITRSRRGGPLPAGVTAYQATGRNAKALAQLAKSGCLIFGQRLADATGRPITLRPGLSGVNGRSILVRDGEILEARSGPGLAARNPRTIVGSTAGGSVVLLTIDGRSTASVGASFAEAAKVARSLGLVQAINLDGGGSTTMVVDGKIVNRISGSAERAVGDALVLQRRCCGIPESAG